MGIETWAVCIKVDPFIPDNIYTNHAVTILCICHRLS